MPGLPHAHHTREVCGGLALSALQDEGRRFQGLPCEPAASRSRPLRLVARRGTVSLRPAAPRSQWGLTPNRPRSVGAILAGEVLDLLARAVHEGRLLGADLRALRRIVHRQVAALVAA